MLGALMRLSTPLATAAALVLLAAPGCAPVRAEPSWGPPPDEGYASEEPYEPEEAPDPEYYRDELDSYGEWHDDPRYGAVWHPTYAPGWQPYTDGYWAWTSYGWTWVSYEPWAWTLHYGRWAALPVGWVWIPGTVWGPAWVDWYWGTGYVGWAPLSPFGHVTVINNFVFVNERDFCSREVRHHFVHHRRINDRHWRARDHRPPRHDRIERVSRHTVTRLDGRPRQTLAPRRDRDRRMARPDTRPDLTGARHGRTERQELRRERREAERTARPASGRSRDGRPDREPRVREPGFRFDADGGDREDRARPDREPRVRQPRVMREPGFGIDDDDDARVERRQPSRGSSGRPRVDSRPGPEPRVRGPRFEADDRPQFQRGHAWAGRGGGGEDRRVAGDGPRMQGGGGRRSESGPRGEGGGVRSGPSMGFAPGAR